LAIHRNGHVVALDIGELGGDVRVHADCFGGPLESLERRTLDTERANDVGAQLLVVRAPEPLGDRAQRGDRFLVAPRVGQSDRSAVERIAEQVELVVAAVCDGSVVRLQSLLAVGGERLAFAPRVRQLGGLRQDIPALPAFHELTLSVRSGRVPLSSVIFAARFADGLPEDLPARLERIRAFYEPVGIDRLSVVNPADNLIAGEVGDGERRLAAGAGTLVWGEQLPAGVDVADAVASQLRAIAGITAAFAWRDGSLVVANSPSGPATLYEAGEAVATHAVAAALLAGAPLELDRTAVAEFVAMDFAGGHRTLLRDVKAVPPASRIILSAEDARREEYWPARERWRLLAEADAYSAAERELVATIRRRTSGMRLGLPLTAGLDSTVAATALSDAGARPAAFTWGNAGWPDSIGAAATAQRFGFAHSVSGFEPLSSEECVADLDREARWADGIAALATVRRSWPHDVDAFVAGMGGESGRAFYYDAWSALFAPRPDSERLLIALGGAGRLRGADDQARAALEQSLREWVDDARATGATGWRVLDVLYAEQRVRRWGRSQLPRLHADVIPLFTPVPIARALVSMPLEERLTDGFHRRFLAARGIQPSSSPADLPRYSRLSWFARRRLYAFRGRRRPPYDDPVDLLLQSVWADKRDVADWLRTEVLRRPAVAESLGAGWAEETWAAFEAGRIRSSERLMRAAGVAAFASALQTT
jgi:hypothetical protein